METQEILQDTPPVQIIEDELLVEQEVVTPRVITTKFSDIAENTFSFTDLGMMVRYDKVFNPANEKTPYWAVHYKREQSNKWETIKGLLSNVYTSVITESVISKISSDLSIDPSVSFHNWNDTTVKCAFNIQADTNPLQLDPDEDLLFKIITGVDTNTLTDRCKMLSVSLVNGHAGEHSITLDYGFINKAKTQDGRIHYFGNFFVLDKFTKNVIHNTNLLINFEDIQNVRTALTAFYGKFKQTNITDQFIQDNIKPLFKKTTLKQFEALWAIIPGDLKNLYYLTAMISYICEHNNDVTLEVKARKIIRKHIVTLIPDWNDVVQV